MPLKVRLSFPESNNINLQVPLQFHRFALLPLDAVVFKPLIVLI